jgi:hypothetical protein
MLILLFVLGRLLIEVEEFMYKLLLERVEADGINEYKRLGFVDKRFEF